MFINNSRLNRFGRCRRRYFWNDIFGGTGLVQVIGGEALEPQYLSLGKAVHAALAFYYEPGAERWKGAQDYGDLATDQYYREASLDPDTCTEEEDELAAYAGKLVRAYLDREAPVDDFTVLKVEEEFRAVLGEVCWKCGGDYGPYTATDGIHYCKNCSATVYYLVGRIDLVLARNKHVGILDHKTVRSFSDDAVAAYAHSFQQIGYAYGYGKAHGTEIRTFGINFLQKLKTVGEPESTTKQCPDCKAGKKKILTCETCFQTGRVPRVNIPTPFRREWFVIEDAATDRYLIATIRKLRDMEAEVELFKSEPDVAYPMEETACLGCKFQSLCWEGEVQEWYNPPNALLEGFERRGADYVDALAAEEKV